MSLWRFFAERDGWMQANGAKSNRGSPPSKEQYDADMQRLGWA